MLKIGDFSKLSRISIRMLRHYDNIGLLVPADTDPFTNYRYYSEAQLATAGRITALKDMGFGLAAMTEILTNYEDPNALAQFLSVRRAELETHATETNHRIRLLETALKRLRKDDTIMNYNVTLKMLPQRYVASVRNVIPAYDQENLLWMTCNEETAHLDLQVDDPRYSLAVFHDKEFKESDVDVEIQLSVKGTYKNTENVVFKTVAPIQFASATYKGGYEQITAVNEAVANWVSDNGYEFDGAMFCIYHVSPGDTRNPEELVTEVCCPVKKRA